MVQTGVDERGIFVLPIFFRGAFARPTAWPQRQSSEEGQERKRSGGEEEGMRRGKGEGRGIGGEVEE